MNNKIQSNQHYFKISQENPEPHLDENYFVIEKHPQLSNYIAGIKEIKEILITIKKLKEEREEYVVLEKYFKKLFEAFNKKFSNYSEFGCFVNACDTARSLVQEDYHSFKKITNLFLRKRKITDKAPANWVQAIIDLSSSRKKSEPGEQKLIKLLSCFGTKRIFTWDAFRNNKKCVARFTKDSFSIKDIRKKLNLKIPTKKQDKNLDLLIKHNNNIFIVEAKHLNVEGEGQNKQIAELIEILSLKKERENIFYIVFIDGTYSNVLLGEISKNAKRKLKQRKDIERYLRKNSNNYWVNTSGLRALFEDLTK